MGCCMLYLRSFNRFNLIGLTLLISGQAHAAIADFTDNGTYTTDTLSGLDWLDATESTNRSYDDISGQLMGGDFDGWRYASAVEVNTFWDNAGGTAPYEGSAASAYWISDLQALWGVTSTDTSGGTITSVLTSTTTVSNTHQVSTMFLIATDPPAGSATLVDVSWFDSAPVEVFGSALVRPSSVPVPAAIWLFGAALIGLVGFRKRKEGTRH
jgi:hypothetical protein